MRLKASFAQVQPATTPVPPLHHMRRHYTR